MRLGEISKKKIQEFNYIIAREKFLYRTISNIGKIEEQEDKIICYVSQDLIEKNSRKAFYELRCSGMNTVYEPSKELVEYYKLNKPVYYIFDGIVFDSYVQLSSHFASIIFKNCTFNNGFQIFWANNVILENNTYNSWVVNKRGNAFLSGSITNLTIKNDQFVNRYELKQYANDNNFGINITVDNLNIINSNICAESKGQINIKAKKTTISDSTISGPEIYLDSDVIRYKDSLLKAEQGIIIENKNNECDTELGFYNVESPYIVYNGEEIITDLYKLSQEERQLYDARQNLTQTFQNMLTRSFENYSKQQLKRLLPKEKED